MNWTLAIERNRQPLLRIVLALFAVLGLDAAGAATALGRVSLMQYRAVLAVLRPAEWAVRRLVVVAAHGVALLPRRAVVTSAPSVKTPVKQMARRSRVSFQLFDPRKNFADFDGFQTYVPTPRIHLLDVTFDPRIPLFRTPVEQPTPIEDVNAEPLLRRLVAIRGALQDLPRQAQRYLRWQAKPFEERRPRLSSTLRPGAPPRYHERDKREIDEILRNCHGLISALPYSPPLPDS